MILQTLPFFGIIALGYGAGQSGFFGPDAVAGLTKFVFFLAMTALLFRFAATLPLSELLDWTYLAAYLCATFAVYGLVMLVARLRRRPWEEAAFEAHTSITGNSIFLGVPLITVLMGPAGITPLMTVLLTDLVVFSSLVVIIVTAAREGRLRLSTLRAVGIGLLRNPMIVSVALGFLWAATTIPLPAVIDQMTGTLGSAATPAALFLIGASLAGKSAERMAVASWLSFAKLVLHPLAVVVTAFWLFPVTRFSAEVMLATAALPVAGNAYMMAAHYNVAPRRVSATILISTIVSLVSITAVIAMVRALH